MDMVFVIVTKIQKRCLLWYDSSSLTSSYLHLELVSQRNSIMFHRCLNVQNVLRLRCTESAGIRAWNNLRPVPQRSQVVGTLSSLAAEAEKGNSTKGEKDEEKSWRENRNIKYWVLGTLGISGSVYYYVRKNHEKKRLFVKSFPLQPGHFVQPREKELSTLSALHGQLKRSGSFTVLHIVGCPGSGKTQLARAFAERLVKEEEESYHFLPGNLLYGTVNASSIDSLLFDTKRFAISVGCLESDWKSKAEEGLQFNSLSSEEQLDCFIEAVREKLNDSQAWILILENANDTEVLNRWFSSDTQKRWGNGTILVTREKNASGDSLVKNTYDINQG